MKGRFGIHGGQYVPETLMNALIELERLMNIIKTTHHSTRSSKTCWKTTLAGPRCCTLPGA